jgi:hypothetical protein
VTAVACVPILSQLTETDRRSPDGFRIGEYASGFQKVRFMTLAPNRDLFVTDTGAGRVCALPEHNQNGTPDSKLVFAEGLRPSHGLA